MGSNGSLGAMAERIEAKYVHVNSYNIQNSRILVEGGHWACWDPIRVIWDLCRTEKAQFGPKKGLLGRLTGTKMPNSRSKCVLTMSQTQLNQISEVLLTQKSPFGAIRANLKMVFLRKINFFAYPIWAQNGHFLTQEGPIWPQTSKT